MAATLTLCAPRKMLSSVCLLPMPFYCSMLNVNMVGVWVGLGGGVGVCGRVAGLGGGLGVCGCSGILHVVQIESKFRYNLVPHV